MKNSRGTEFKPTHWTLDEDYEIAYGPSDVNWESPDGWLSITNGVWKIKKGFKWDGCTDVPDFLNKINPKTKKSRAYYASLVHDVGYRYLRLCPGDFPYTKFKIDKFFLDIGKRDGFVIIGLYFLGVLTLGEIYIRFYDNIVYPQ